MDKSEPKPAKVIGVNDSNSAMVTLIMSHKMDWAPVWRSSVTRKATANEVEI